MTGSVGDILVASVLLGVEKLTHWAVVFSVLPPGVEGAAGPRVQRE